MMTDIEVMQPVSDKHHDALEQQLLNLFMQVCESMQSQKNNENTPLENTAFISCYRGTQQYYINPNDIEYINSNPVTGVHAYVDGEEFHTNLTLKALEERHVFMRCHRQYLINVRCIKMIEKMDNGLGKLYTYNGQVMPVSRRYMSEI